MAIFKLHPEGRIREIFENLPLHLNHVVFGHISRLILSLNGLEFHP
jgi:hypothetical protein